MWKKEYTSFVYPEHLDNGKINIVNLVMRFIDSMDRKKDAVKIIKRGNIRINDEVISDISREVEIKNDIKIRFDYYNINTIKLITSEERKRGIENQAKKMSKEYQEDKDIKTILWFPHDKNVRIIYTVDGTFATDEYIDVIYCCSEYENDYSYPSEVGIIRCDEKGKVDLPIDWNEKWENAIVLYEQKKFRIQNK